MEAADWRIRRFSVRVWTAGLLLLVLLVFLPAPQAALSAAGTTLGWRTVPPGPLPDPWVDPSFALHPQAVAVHNGYRWEGQGRAVIELPADLLAEVPADSILPLHVHLRSDATAHLLRIEDLNRFHLRETLDFATGTSFDRDPQLIMLAPEQDVFYVEGAGEWTLELLRPEIIQAADGTARGEGTAVLRYDGGATSAQMTSPGGSALYLSGMAYWKDGKEFLEVPEGGGRVSWDGSTGPVWIEVTTDGPWKFEAD